MRSFLQWIIPALAVLVSSAFHASAQCDSIRLANDSLQWVVAGNLGKVMAMDKYNDTLYFGGSFKYVGKYTGSCVGVDRTTGSINNLNSWPKSNGRVNVIISDGSGGIIIGGDFTRVGDSLRTNVARINASGVVTPFKANTDGEVRSLLLHNGILYVGGQFTTVNGTARSILASLDLAASTVTSWNPGSVGYSVNSLATDGTNLYAGGEFTSFNSVIRRDIAAFNLSTGALTSLNIPVNPTGSGYVNVLLVHNNKLYAGGDFSSFGGVTRNYAGAIDLSTGTVASWNPNANGYLYSMAARNDTIFVGGVFFQIGGASRGHIAALNANSGSATAWDPHVAYPGNVQSLAVSGNTVYVGGYFYQVGSFFTNHFAAIDLSTAQVSNLGLSTYEYFSDVSALYVTGNTLYLGGRFASLGGEERQSFAALDVKNNKLLPLNLNFYFNTSIKTIKVDNATLYIGGAFSSLRIGTAQNRNCLASFDMSNSYALNAWNPLGAVSLSSPYDDIRTIEITPTHYYIGGRFTFTSGSTNTNAARINRATGFIDTWQPAYQYNSYISGFSVNALSLLGTRLYIGGEFGIPSNQFIGNLMHYDFGNNASVYAQLNGSINTIKRAGDRFYLGGGFSGVGSTTRNGAMMTDTSASMTLLKWSPNVFGNVNDLYLSKDRVYLGGYFTAVGGKNRNHFAVVDTVTGALWPWNPAFDMSPVRTWTNSFSSGTPVRKVIALGDTVFVGGDFDELSGKNITGLARFHLDNYQLPNVKIIASASPVCAGTNITYTATSNISAVNYEWKVNGTVTGNSSTYNYVPANGDKVTCKTTVSGTGCYVRDNAVDTFIVNVQPRITPSISVAGPAKQVNGWDVTLTANVNNAGSTYSIEWKNNGVVFSTTTTPVTTYTKTAGIDNITATVMPVGCFDTVTSNAVVIQENVGVSDIASNKNITIYPNPVKDVLNIAGLANGDIIEMTDITDRSIQRWNAGSDEPNQRFILKQVQTGNYFIKIYDRNGSIRFSQPIQK